MSSSIRVKRKDGIIAEYVKPKWCDIPDEEWKTSLGYCWTFAIVQDANGENSYNTCEDTCMHKIIENKR